MRKRERGTKKVRYFGGKKRDREMGGGVGGWWGKKQKRKQKWEGGLVGKKGQRKNRKKKLNWFYLFVYFVECKSVEL